jgi:hypothetical protein
VPRCDEATIVRKARGLLRLGARDDATLGEQFLESDHNLDDLPRGANERARVAAAQRLGPILARPP